ncbi:MAG TPA: hypothetical protein VJR89_24575 [Polyangiales bacterium]|nr:hypothetical protein [Polyangiales bacterium]
MRGTAQQLLGSLIAVVAVSCGDEPAEEEAGRPATFGNSCMLGGLDPCQDPFVCLELPSFSTDPNTGPICTVACQQNEDCPSWQETSGSCTGKQQQSQCVRLICRDVSCP